MPRNGTGTYALPLPAVVTGASISSADYNATAQDLGAALTGSLARDGQGAMTGNLPMGGNRITGMADGINATDAVTRQQVVLASLLPLPVANGGTGATTAAAARTALGVPLNSAPVVLQPTTGAGLTIPGTSDQLWDYFAESIADPAGTLNGVVIAGQVPGGTTVDPGVPSRFWRGWAKRVA